MKSKIIFIAMALTLSACATDKQAVLSVAEQVSGYTYIPVDPFPVKTMPGDSCKDQNNNDISEKALLDCLPDNAVRMLIEHFDANGTVSYGQSNVKASGDSYKVTVDYINSDTINVPVWIVKTMTNIKTDDNDYVPLLATADKKLYKPGSELYTVTRTEPKKDDNTPYVQYNIPVYVGIGLRVAADVNVIDASAHLSGLGVIGADAQAEKLKGSLIVQTLGINGKSISAALPVQSDLNRTTAENAIVAVGTIKSQIYADETIINPRVVGIYLPFPGGKPLVNALISALSDGRVEWYRPCKVAPSSAISAQKK